MSNQTHKQVVLLTGASGSMGYEAFKLLWDQPDRYDIVLLLRPSRKNRKRFGNFKRNGFRIVWGDALNRQDVEEACKGIDWCLHCMAIISPEADRHPDMARKVNVRATRYLVEAIEAQDPEHIRLVYIGSVAMYGDRLPPVHVGRVGDPLIPSVYDHYSITKIEGELAVMESCIKHKVSFRQTFIMIPRLFSLMDPIMFHQPINSFMENITARDSGRLLLNCLDLPDDSDLWGRYFNLSGGPGCRTTYLEFLDRIYRMLGIDYRKVMERHWFALKNFHMQFYEDAYRLNEYLHHWEGGDSQEDFYRIVWKNLPWYMKVIARLNKTFPPFKWLAQKVARGQLKRLAYRSDGTMGWIHNGDNGKINASFGSLKDFRSIPGWDRQMPSLDHDQDYTRLDHGYDESKEEFTIKDLQRAAQFRGGVLAVETWDGDMRAKLTWRCCREHTFLMTPHAVLKGGHWCVECISPPWNYHEIVTKNRFARQVFTQS